MMDRLPDDELLKRAARGSRQALAEIARRNIGFVFHSALRQVRDRHLAEDVAQAVFVILTRKIARLKSGTVMHAWLFTTTRYAASNALKMRNRRTYHEHTAAALRTERIDPPETDSISPLLDEALAELREADRTAVLRSYFAQKSWREVGEAIEVSEDTARKRVGRAIELLRAIFARRGIKADGLSLIAVMKSSVSAAVPDHLMRTVTSSLLSASTSSAAGGIAQGVIQMMTWMKIKIAAAFVGLTAVCLGGGMLAAGGGAPPAPPAQSAAQSDATSVRLGDHVRVELLGVAAVPTDNGRWWNADGRTISPPCDERDPSALSDGGYQAAILVEAPKDSSIAIRASPSMTTNTQAATREGQPLAGVTHMEFELEDGQKMVDFLVRVGSGEFQTLLDCVDPAEGAVAEFGDGQTNLEPVTTDGSSATRAIFNHKLNDYDVRVRAFDAAGTEYAPVHQLTHDDGSANELEVSFAVAPAQVRRIKLMARTLDKWVYFEKVTLDPARKEDFRVITGNDPTTMPGR